MSNDPSATPTPVREGSEATARDSGADLRKLQRALRSSLSLQSLSLLGIFLLGFLYTLHFARGFFLPIIVALLLNFLLSPLVRSLERQGLPRSLASAVTLSALLGCLIGVLFAIAEPARNLIAEAPSNVPRIERELRRFREPVEQMERAAEQVGELTRIGESTPDPVEVRQESAVSAFLSGSQRFIAGAATMTILLFFLLAADDLLLRKLVRMLPNLSDRKRVVAITRHIERDISVHLLTVSAINCGLGLAVGGALYLLGMPNPILWGVMAAVLNFVPYLGALVGVTILTGVSLLAFDQPLQELAPPAVYLFLTVIEGGVITPMILGKRLSLNPVAVFLGLFFWGWLWGIAGALLAVPILMSLKIAFDRIETLAPLGELLGS